MIKIVHYIQRKWCQWTECMYYPIYTKHNVTGLLIQRTLNQNYNAQDAPYSQTIDYISKQLQRYLILSAAANEVFRLFLQSKKYIPYFLSGKKRFKYETV